MTLKTNQPRRKEFEEFTGKNLEADCWNQERMLESLLRDHDEEEQNWVEKGLPKLVDDIMANYQAFGGMDHLEGRDLPSKK